MRKKTHEGYITDNFTDMAIQGMKQFDQPYYEFGPPHWVKPNYGIRTERYKLINYYTDNQWELFDLEKDPDEMESLFNWGKVEPEYEKVASSLVKQLKALRSKYKDDTGIPVSIRFTETYD